MAATQPIPAPTEPELEQAVATLWHEFDEAIALLMLTVDLFDEAQRTRRPITVPNLRKALGKKIQPAIRARNEALAALGIDAEAEAS